MASVNRQNVVRKGYVLPAVLASYGTPQPYAPPPYITTSTRRVSVRTQQWSTGLCCCLDDPGNCLVTCFCPCVTFGLIAEIVDRGTSTCTCDGGIYGTLRALTGLACLYSCSCQSKLRVQYDLPEAHCMDCFVHFCCETCALCQEYRELKNRGFDLSIGSIGRRPKNPYALAHKADLPGLECEELKVMLEAGRLLHNRG